VTNTVIPNDVTSGTQVTWQIFVHNHGIAQVTVNSIHVVEQIISGPQGAILICGQQTFPARWPNVAPGANSKVYEIVATLYNFSSYNVSVRNTVTVNSNGGESSASTTYTIRP